MKVLAWWVDSESPNFGVRALAEGLLASLPESAEVTFVSHRQPFLSGVLNLKNLAGAALGLNRELVRELKTFELAIDVGEGDSFASVYGWKRYSKLVASKLASSRYVRNSVIAPQTLGPWNSRWTRVLARLVLKQVSEVWARDTDSSRRARGLGKTVREGTDLVFAVPLPQVILEDVPEVLVNVSGLLWTENSHVDSFQYRRVVRSLLDDLVAEGRTFGLLSHVQAPGEADDDTHVMESLAADYHGVTTYAPSSLHELRSIIGGAKLLIGSRMHACLNAISLGVPAIPLAYSDKFAPLFSDLGYDYGHDLRKVPAGWNLSREELADDSLRTQSALQAQKYGHSKIQEFQESIARKLAVRSEA